MKVIINPVTQFAQNSSLLICERTQKAAIVDPGGDIDKLLQRVDETGCDVEKVLVTHGHIDHAGSVADISERLSVPIEGPHRDDEFWIAQLPMQGELFGLGGARVFRPDRWLLGGDVVEVGEVQLQVIHCPGHTPGHVVYFEPVTRVAIVGDVLFQGSIGRTDFPRGNHADLVASIRGKLFPLGDDVRFVPGHGPTSTFGRERQINPFVGDHAMG